MTLSLPLLHHLNQLHGREVTITNDPLWKMDTPLVGRIIGWSYELGVDDEPQIAIRFNPDCHVSWANEVTEIPLSEVPEPNLCRKDINNSIPDGWFPPKYWFNQLVKVKCCFKLSHAGRIVGLEYHFDKGWQYSIGVDSADRHSQVEPMMWVEESQVTPLNFHKPQINEKLAALMPAPFTKELSRETCC